MENYRINSISSPLMFKVPQFYVWQSHRWFLVASLNLFDSISFVHRFNLEQHLGITNHWLDKKNKLLSTDSWQRSWGHIATVPKPCNFIFRIQKTRTMRTSWAIFSRRIIVKLCNSRNVLEIIFLISWFTSSPLYAHQQWLIIF